MAIVKRQRAKYNYVLPLIGVFLVLVMLFVLLFANSSIRLSVWHQTIDDNQSLTSQSAAVVSSVMNRYVSEIDGCIFYADSAFSGYRDEFDAFNAFSLYAKRLESYKLIYFLADGRIINDAGNALNAAPSEVAKLIASGGERAVSEPFFDSTLKGDSFLIYRAIPDNTRVTAVCGYFSSASLYDACGFSYSDKLLYFVNSEGRIIFAPFEYQNYNSATGTSVTDVLSEYDVEDTFKNDLLSAIKNGVTMSVSDYENRRIASVGGISNTGWNAVIIVPSAELSSGVGSALKMTIAVGVIVLVCFVGMFFYFSIANRRYIKRMLDAENNDPVAGCSNQSKFELDAEELLIENTSTSYAMMYMNISNYNYISQIYGFQTANEMIAFVANIIRKTLDRRELFGRMSDGRFALLVRRSEETEARITAMTEKISDFAPLHNNRYRASVGIGVYIVDRSKSYTVAEMLDRAVIAVQSMDDRAGVLFAYYQVETHEELLKIAEIEDAMEAALKNGQFKMYLQPKYNLIHDRIDGAEALVRWVRPDGNMVMPSKFIPIFEKNGFIAELDRYIFDQTCMLIQNLIKNGKRVVPISVNVSRASARNPDFLDYYISTKKRYGIADHFLELEFTESLAMENYDVLSRTITELRSNGFSCSIDDFGEGFSSFKALKTMPFDVIKLDKFFLMQSSNRNRDEYLIVGVIAMAKALEMKVIMEGVETEEELALLRRIKCDAIQGYIYSQPLKSEDFVTFLENAFDKKPFRLR